METQGIQINKFISSTGFCSRREADILVEQERVTINGKLAKPTSRVGENDKVAVDDEVIKNKKTESLYIAFNKPKGITSTTDEKDKTSITAYINHNKRIFPIGRLDKDSEGLILLTDDGDIVNKILRAGNEHEKEYIVTVDKPVTPEFVIKMAEGVSILDTVTRPCVVKSLGSKKFKIILTQGLNRQIRRMCEALGYKVSELKRVRIMHIGIGDLPLGKWRKLTPTEINRMNEFVKGSSKTPHNELQIEGAAPKGKKVKSRDHYKHAPQFNREDKGSKKRASKFIQPFKAGDEVLKPREPFKGKPAEVRYPAGIENQKNRFSKAVAKKKYDGEDLGFGKIAEKLITPKPSRAKGKYVAPVPKDKITLKQEKNARSKEHLQVRAKQSSRKNFNAGAKKKKSGK